MRIGVIGGKLQGIETIYLSKKAGWESVLVDKDPAAPAAELCDYFYQLDVTDTNALTEVLREVDFVVPALENKQALESIHRCAREAGVALLYDPHAYAISSSKIASDKLFADLGIPAPQPWPHCDFPVIIKPSGASGSEEVYKAETRREFEKIMAKLDPSHGWVVQEYLEGPSYSLEVVGAGGGYQLLQVTELEMDGAYDCKRVMAPVLLSDDLVRQFEETSLAIARGLKLNGIMDVEVILHQGKLKVLEIDARLPSQTPTAVYQSTGINMLEELWRGAAGEKRETLINNDPARGVIYEHISVSPFKVEVCGEHIMADARPLQMLEDFFGADEAITNYHPGKDQWVATLIITGENLDEAWLKRCRVIERIMGNLGIQDYEDLLPAV